MANMKITSMVAHQYRDIHPGYDPDNPPGRPDPNPAQPWTQQELLLEINRKLSLMMTEKAFQKAMEPVAEQLNTALRIIAVLDQRTNELNQRLKVLEKARMNGGGAPTPQSPDAA